MRVYCLICGTIDVSAASAAVGESVFCKKHCIVIVIAKSLACPQGSPLLSCIATIPTIFSLFLQNRIRSYRSARILLPLPLLVSILLLLLGVAHLVSRATQMRLAFLTPPPRSGQKGRQRQRDASRISHQSSVISHQS